MEGLSKVNETIQELGIRVKEIEEYDVSNDFNTRDGDYSNSGYLVANIKVNDWIGINDVDDVITQLDAHRYKDEIHEEFTDERLSGIHSHACEYEVEYMQEKYQDLVHVNDQRKTFRVYSVFFEDGKIPDSQPFYKQHYERQFKEFFKRKHNTPKDYWNYLKLNNEFDIEERDRLESFTRECNQYGRSGGWFSICERGELEGHEFDWEVDYHLTGITDNDEFNRRLRSEFDIYSQDKNDLIKEMKDFIKSWENIFNNIKYYINEIEDGVEDFKETLLDRLYTEITDFLYDINADHANVTIELTDDKNRIKTTMGVSIDRVEFEGAFNKCKLIFKKLTDVGDKLPIKMKVSHYLVEYARKIENDILIKAGCHRFSLNNITQTLNIQL